MALPDPIFLPYEWHVVFQILKVSAMEWRKFSVRSNAQARNSRLEKRIEIQSVQGQLDQSSKVMENGSKLNDVGVTSDS